MKFTKFKALAVACITYCCPPLFAQNCWDSLYVDVTNSKCFGSNSGSIWLHYYPREKNNYLFAEAYNDLTGEVVLSSSVSSYGGIIPMNNLKPGKYKVVIKQLSPNDLSEICHTISYPEVLENGCNVQVNETSVNQDPLSADFLTSAVKVSGSFCAFGYRNPLYMKVNGHEMAWAGVPAGNYDHYPVNTGFIIDYVKPGDTLQFGADNGNEAPWNSPAPMCRNYGAAVQIENDIRLENLHAIRCPSDPNRVDIIGVLSTKYLALKNNPLSYLFNQWARDNIFRITILDANGKLIDYVDISDTSGRFWVPVTRPVDIYHDLLFNLRIGNVVYEKKLEIDSIPRLVWRGGNSTDWFNTANWTCGKIPGPTDDVLIDKGTAIIDKNIIVKSIKCSEGAAVKLLTGVTLTVKQ